MTLSAADVIVFVTDCRDGYLPRTLADRGLTRITVAEMPEPRAKKRKRPKTGP